MDKIIRIRYSTLKRLQRAIPPRKDEALSAYFERVEKSITSFTNERRARASETSSPASKE